MNNKLEFCCRLNANLVDTPIWWRDFVNLVISKHSQQKWNNLPSKEKYFKAEFKKFGGEYTLCVNTENSTKTRTVIFNNEQSLLLFVLATTGSSR